MIRLSETKSLGATYATPWIDCRIVKYLSIHWASDNTSSPVGALTVEESDDPVVVHELNGSESTSSTAKVVNTSADSLRISAAGTGLTVNAANATMITITRPAAFVRLKYTRTSGGATAVANCYAHIVEDK